MKTRISANTSVTDTSLSLRALSKSFNTPAGKVHAVRAIDLDILPGEIVALLGPNGAGKTTIIDMLLGLTSPDGGSVQVLGQAPRKAVQRGEISAVLQTGGLLADLRVEETLQAIGALYALSKDRVEEVIEMTDLQGIRKRQVGKCSGGQQQRLKFALALLPDPKVLILDEPTTGLDVSARKDFWRTMEQQALGGRTVIFATHYLEEAEQFSDRTVLMREGVIVADGSTAQIQAQTSGRQISVRLPRLRVPAAVGSNAQGSATAAPEANSNTQLLARIAALQGVRNLEQRGDRVSLIAADSDAVALKLLTTFGGTDLEIQAPSLESTFIELTRK